MMKNLIRFSIVSVVLLVVLIASGSFYSLDETKQAVVTRFGQMVGEPITTPGLKFKLPFVHKVNFFEKRVLEWDGPPTEVTTKDKTYILVNTYARWVIVDPLAYFEKLRDESSAISRLNDILGSETRNTIAKHELIELIRTSKDRKPQLAEDIAEADISGNIGRLIPIRRGRAALEEDILNSSRPKLAEFGIDLLDIQFKRINYNQGVQERIYERMISERQQIAERFRSEGVGEAAKILGTMERDLLEIESEAYKKVETTRGLADAKATEIYAQAFNQSEHAAEFYQFLRTMELYPSMLKDSTLVLSTNSDLFKYLKRVDPLENASTAMSQEATALETTSPEPAGAQKEAAQAAPVKKAPAPAPLVKPAAQPAAPPVQAAPPAPQAAPAPAPAAPAPAPAPAPKPAETAPAVQG